MAAGALRLADRWRLTGADSGCGQAGLQALGSWAFLLGLLLWPHAFVGSHALLPSVPMAHDYGMCPGRLPLMTPVTSLLPPALACRRPERVCALGHRVALLPEAVRCGRAGAGPRGCQAPGA